MSLVPLPSLKNSKRGALRVFWQLVVSTSASDDIINYVSLSLDNDLCHCQLRSVDVPPGKKGAKVNATLDRRALTHKSLDNFAEMLQDSLDVCIGNGAWEEGACLKERGFYNLLLCGATSFSTSCSNMVNRRKRGGGRDCLHRGDWGKGG